MKKKTILIADDEASIRLLVSNMLSKNYVVLEASDGQEAIDIARTQKPDIILMDIMMPNVDGYSACYTIKKDETTSVIPVVMVTALGFNLNKALADKVRADGYITKPFSLRSLMDVISRFLKQE